MSDRDEVYGLRQEVADLRQALKEARESLDSKEFLYNCAGARILKLEAELTHLVTPMPLSRLVDEMGTPLSLTIGGPMNGHPYRCYPTGEWHKGAEGRTPDSALAALVDIIVQADHG